MQTIYKKFPFLKNKALQIIVEVVLSLVAMLIGILIVYFTNVPNPNMILIAILVIVSSFWGYPAATAAGLMMTGYSLYFFSTDHSFFSFTEVNAQKMVVILIGIIVCIVFIGTLHMANGKSKRKLEEANNKLSSQNMTLSKVSSTDPLTEANNRYAYKEDSHNYLDKPIHLMIIDLDNFKSINDNYGHAVGDVALKAMANALVDIFGSEYVYRLGGDEFLVIAIGSEDKAFQKKIGFVRESIDGLRINEILIPLYFSAGYVYGQASNEGDLKAMSHEADVCLYEAKKKGKNCFVGKPHLD